AGAGLMAWWLSLAFVYYQGASWDPKYDGVILMSAISAAVSGAHVLGEANLRRRRPLDMLWRVALSLLLALVFTGIWYGIWHGVLQGLIFGAWEEDAGDSSLVTLSFRVGAFAMGGLATGTSTLLVRKFQGFIEHLGAGLAAGLCAGAAWHLLSSTGLGTDLYLAGAAMGVVWGLVFGLLAWGVPDELYAGWIRVLTPNRHALRIPVDAPDGAAKERFVGHFPRGLDLFLGVEDGVQELHLSVYVDDDQRYAARGLGRQPTQVKRLLESVDLSYDPSRPAPLETELRSGDRIRIGDGERQAELEFILLPKEER
ncbi:MAG: hypothetical protein VX265_04960, partial [Myxococcota bacterium]|nr:hypothetical protein [Myxococcota bacterium]